MVTHPREPAPTCRELRKTQKPCAGARPVANRRFCSGAPRFLTPRDRVLCGVCDVGRVGGPTKKMKGGCRRLVIIRGCDGAATVSREKVSHTMKIMMGNDGGVSCESCVMMVMAMAVSCGGYDGVIDDGNVIRSPSPTGLLHRAFRKHIFRPRGTANPVFQMPCDPTPVGSVGACDVICNDVVM